jgi:hypothetical protein
LIVVTGNIKEEALNRELAKSNERIAELNNETAWLYDSLLANAKAGKANALASLSTRAVTEVISSALGLTAPGAISEATKPWYIISKVAPFAGKQFDAVVTSSDLKLEALLLSLRHALKEAGWIEVDRIDVGTTQSSTDGATLVSIHVDASKDSELLNAAETLASALNAEGIAATVHSMTKTDSANANVIHILVGHKP